MPERDRRTDEELHPSDQSEPGIVRRRRGRGFGYERPDGRPVRDAATLARIRALAIPPAWQDVWICTSPRGHLQAVGTDSAGRRQYRYHDLWREQQDRAKFDRVLEVAERLPAFRKAVDDQLQGPRADQAAGAGRRGQAARHRLLPHRRRELRHLRPGTLRMEHVTCSGGLVVCSYQAKGDVAREVEVADPAACKVLRSLKALGVDGELLRYRHQGGWSDIRSEDINDYLREIIGYEVTAKDFRTWHATRPGGVGPRGVPAGARGRHQQETRRHAGDARGVRVSRQHADGGAGVRTWIRAWWRRTTRTGRSRRP
ncbi:hypothetical protein GCM10020220_110960 [Nonomuraea rubra]|uniref:DNA topoisomerase IB n=1 Tax=Nonomuraea rubra TaxID=46180 RepID=UPI0031E96835